jgi:hypothetical protein
MPECGYCKKAISYSEFLKGFTYKSSVHRPGGFTSVTLGPLCEDCMKHFWIFTQKLLDGNQEKTDMRNQLIENVNNGKQGE